MSKAELLVECEMWRNMWNWTPSAVKYYTSRIGSQVGIMVRNYKRLLGTLLETYWDLTELEVGVYDKVYDQVSGEFFYERKIVKLPASQIVAFDWISERISETDLAEKLETEELAKETEEA